MKNKPEDFQIVGMESPFRYGSVTVQWSEYYAPHKGSTRNAHATFYGQSEDDSLEKARLFKTSPEMLALIRAMADEYTGRDNLSTLDINLGREAEELLAAYEGREPIKPED